MTTTEHGLDYGCEACQQPTCTPDDPNCPARPPEPLLNARPTHEVRAWEGFRRNPDTGQVETGTYTRIIPTADVLRALPYQAPAPGWHAHGMTLIPTDGCAACAELRARAAESAAAGGAPIPPATVTRADHEEPRP